MNDKKNNKQQVIPAIEAPLLLTINHTPLPVCQSRLAIRSKSAAAAVSLLTTVCQLFLPLAALQSATADSIPHTLRSYNLLSVVHILQVC
jgi:hypothetical protein